MSDTFELESFKNQLVANLIPLYVMHRQNGLSEADALAKAREEMQFLAKSLGIQEVGRKHH